MIDSDVEMITITPSHYSKLKQAAKKLACLEAGGVDNWDWYSESLERGGYFDNEEEND